MKKNKIGRLIIIMAVYIILISLTSIYTEYLRLETWHIINSISGLVKDPQVATYKFIWQITPSLFVVFCGVCMLLKKNWSWWGVSLLYISSIFGFIISIILNIYGTIQINYLVVLVDLVINCCLLVFLFSKSVLDFFSIELNRKKLIILLTFSFFFPSNPIYILLIQFWTV